MDGPYDLRTCLGSIGCRCSAMFPSNPAYSAQFHLCQAGLARNWKKPNLSQPNLGSRADGNGTPCIFLRHPLLGCAHVAVALESLLPRSIRSTDQPIHPIHPCTLRAAFFFIIFHESVWRLGLPLTRFTRPIFSALALFGCLLYSLLCTMYEYSVEIGCAKCSGLFRN